MGFLTLKSVDLQSGSPSPGLEQFDQKLSNTESQSIGHDSTCYTGLKLKTGNSKGAKCRKIRKLVFARNWYQVGKAHPKHGTKRQKFLCHGYSVFKKRSCIYPYGT